MIIVLASSLNVNGGTIGNSANPAWVTLNLYAGNVALNSGASIYGYVTAPAGVITINSGGQLVGGVASNALTLNTNGWLRLAPSP